jgi:hypothetical protein
MRTIKGKYESLRKAPFGSRFSRQSYDVEESSCVQMWKSSDQILKNQFSFMLP